jgi:hypothetical protein
MSRLRTVPAAAAKSPAERLRAAAGRGARSLARSPDCSEVLSRPQRKVQRRAPRRHAEALSGAARRRHASLESNICRGASTVLAAHPSAAASSCSGGHQRGECQSKTQPFVLFRVKKSPRQSRKVTRVWVVLALILLTALTRLSRAVDPASADRRRQRNLFCPRGVSSHRNPPQWFAIRRGPMSQKLFSLSLGPQRSNPQMKALILNGCARSHHRIGARRKRHRIALRRATGDKDPQRSPSPRWCIDQRAQDIAVRQPRARYQSRERAQRGRHNSHSTPSLGDVAIGVRGFFHAYIRRGVFGIRRRG